ncbi:DUF4387 domain-containing protein [Hydrogenophaga electricum]|uniref:Acyl-CoA synthetase n=1 Tax=Hydrogenophaga electricum TaxID=1230953 RepID=A0ABQ6C3W6_9BURK|nr:DUF4387 domain-containing protein [Hydrogenophaga electricum]GLS14595.1 acyl-CoA synthetase [Hydrogenophaga electricum]
MTRLRDIAKLIRTKNAGPFQLTLDIMFPDARSYAHVVDSGVINPAAMAAFFKVDASKVRLFNYAPGNAIKVTVPRLVTSGDPADTDLFGGQQFGPLVDLEVPPLDP